MMNEMKKHNQTWKKTKHNVDRNKVITQFKREYTIFSNEFTGEIVET